MEHRYYALELQIIDHIDNDDTTAFIPCNLITKEQEEFLDYINGTTMAGVMLGEYSEHINIMISLGMVDTLLGLPVDSDPETLNHFHGGPGGKEEEDAYDEIVNKSEQLAEGAQWWIGKNHYRAWKPFVADTIPVGCLVVKKCTFRVTPH